MAIAATRLKMKQRRRAFTFVDTLQAAWIVFACAMVVAITIPAATASRIKNDFSNRAAGLAQKQLEAVKATGYPNITATQLLANGLIDSGTPVATNTYSFTNVDSGVVDNPSAILPNGTGRLRVEQVDIDLRRVTVTVSWTERGKSKSLTVGTLVANL